MTQFFEQIVYSAANEDPLSEIKGLNLNSNDKVLCITGSGARVLDLLCHTDCHITAVDFNATQNYLLELKMAAIKCLEYDSLLDFLGVNPCSNRLDLFAELIKELSAEASAFWQKKSALIVSGVLYQGVWERYMKYIAKLLAFKGKTAGKMFASQSIKEQSLIWNTEWKSPFWKILVYLLGRRAIWKYILKEPGIAYVPKNFDISGYLYQRFEHVANTQLFGSNPYLNLIFYNKYSNHCLPLHLHKENYTILKKRLKNISIKTCSLQQALEESLDHYTAFSISDFSSYSTKEHYEDIWKRILKSAKDKAKFVERSFLVQYDLPQNIVAQVQVHDALSHELSDLDHSFIYNIRCGTIHKEDIKEN